ncbi:MAG: conjugative transposon protein TraN [Agriterribacter sp.]
MNRISAAVVSGILVLLQFTAKAQLQNDDSIRTKTIEPYRLTVSYNKTSNLIFPFAIKSVDRGSAAVLVQKAKGVENILQIKAGQQNFTQTNLSIVTGDGHFYSLIVDYADDPYVLNIFFFKDTAAKKTNAFLSDTPVDEEAMKILAENVDRQKRFLHTRTSQQKMRLSLESIYVHPQTMWFTLQLENKSLINYNPDHVRFFIRDRKRAKRTAVQENELQSVYTSNPSIIEGQSTGKFIVAFAPFTISTSKELIIQVTEQHGGRSLFLPVKYKAILKARLLQ